MSRIAWGALALVVMAPGLLSAQTMTVSELKEKIFDAKMIQKGFGGLKFCKELDGSNFYLPARNRLLNLADFNASLQNLVRERAFNPDKRRPWNEEDAKLRMEQVQRQAQQDKASCDLVAALPALERQLQELEKK